MAIRLNDVQPVRLNRGPNRARYANRNDAEAFGELIIELPDVGYVPARYHNCVPEGRWLRWKERHCVRIAIHLAHIGVVSRHNLAKGALIRLQRSLVHDRLYAESTQLSMFAAMLA